MTVEEALRWLHLMKWHLSDSGHAAVAHTVEDAEGVVLRTPHLAGEYSGFVLSPGKRGRVTMVLVGRYEARALALLVGVLRSVDVSPSADPRSP